MSSSAARESRHLMGGFSVACAGIEALARSLAGEVGRHGVRVIAIRPNLIPDTAPDMTEADLEPLLRDTVSGQLPRLADVATMTAFAASDAAAALTGSVLNLSCGAIVD